ncbi:hypothetical protein [Rufibacter tibetensis]|uniref:Uncharacterized protein n=1 Tax=Rufibacter tibetensis TaxID=512763 RepID=A0A0P0C9V7_9BACT|nr:hypothetical protein [Rufibacter tibetensis]ALJ00395.1 hypothetical protein DC20_17225 [Rufibacter tibetensis]
MMTFPFEISGKLVFTVLQDQVLVVAEKNFVIANFKDHAAFERVLKNVLPPSKGSGILESLEKAKELNQKLGKLGVVLDLRVNNYTYVEFGTGPTPRITANAVFGKVGSWFRKS